MNKVKILATASEHPQKRLTNDDLSKMVETTQEWITERTGILERRISSTEGGDTPSDLGFRAAKKAIEEIDFDPNLIDGIICATMTPDHKMPNTACLIQKKLNITNNCMAYDLNAACSGFIYALNAGAAYIKTGLFRHLLIVGTESISPFLDYTDRKSCIIFGDGAGVALLGECNDGQSDILAASMKANGRDSSLIFVKNGGSAHPINQDNIDSGDQYVTMDGQRTFKLAVKTMAEDSLNTLRRAELTIGDIDWMVPHQANKRILEAVAQRMDFPLKKVLVNIESFGNTSAATIPTCLDEGIRKGRIKRGHKVLLTGFGAGSTWASTVMRY